MRPVAMSAMLALLVAASAAKQNVKPASEYFNICSYNDPKLGECVKNSIQSMKPKLIKGISELELPPLDPLFIQQLVFEQGSGNSRFRQELTNVTVYGLAQYTVQNVKVDLDKSYIEVDMVTPYMRFDGHYTMEGMIQRVPISGSGQSVYNFTGVHTVAYTQGEVVKRNGQDYFHVKDLKWKIEVEGASTHLTNLFNGDKNLGDATNAFLNENWRETFTTFKYLAEDAFGILFKDLSNRVYNAFPMKDLFKGWQQRQAS